MVALVLQPIAAVFSNSQKKLLRCISLRVSKMRWNSKNSEPEPSVSEKYKIAN
jgi:hypothetical protein